MQTKEGGRPAPEEIGRANLYALIGRLFYSPPDENLLLEISRAAEAAVGAQDGRGLIAAWRALREACRGTTPESVREEFDMLFVGVGRAQVTPYLSAYAESPTPDRYLVRLRDQLAEWGFLRRNNVFEVEDHVSALSDVMRLLVEKGRPLREQQQFFAGFVYPGAIPFLAAVERAPAAGFYKVVAAFALAFFEVEEEAFEMID